MKQRDTIASILSGLYLVLLVVSLLFFAKLVYLQWFFKPDPKIEAALTPRRGKRILEPVRGNIIDSKGRLLAMTYPVYDLHMDCTVRKDEFAKIKNPELAKQSEEKWLSSARQMCEGLSTLLPEKSAEQYFSIIKNGRANGKKYVQIAKRIDMSTLDKIRALPLYNEGSNKGGLIVSQHYVRKYPYGRLARRTIGFVRDNSIQSGNTHIGLEGKFDALLHGTDGVESLRETDYGSVRDFDSSFVKAIDGKDLRTTIDIDLQDIADRFLRSKVDSLQDIDGACLVLMEVNSGAIRAMVNLQRDPSSGNTLEEITNHSIGRKCEPGSVFKTVTLLSCLDDGYVKSLEETIPTNHGYVKGTSLKQDTHIADWERDNKTRTISVYDGFKISSNYVLSSLALNNYRNSSRHFIERIYSYGLGDSFDFDLEGLATPTIPSIPKGRELNPTVLGSVAFGYSTEETPLHILTFYNAIAAGGKMMKPYLVESIEKDGKVIEKRGPAILNASICSKAAADTITRALIAVTEEGTAKRLKKAKCTVAGKTGTSFATFAGGKYSDSQGRHKYQGTFVGFFPAENPKYSIVCCVYSKPTKHQYQGGGIPAMVVREVVDYLVDTQPYWQGSLRKSGAVPKMEVNFEPDTNCESDNSLVPNLKGLGLKDALYLIENSGFVCSYSGSGHVYKQSPSAGNAKKGSTIKIELR